jgi:hypothetical protein
LRRPATAALGAVSALVELGCEVLGGAGGGGCQVPCPSIRVTRIEEIRERRVDTAPFTWGCGAIDRGSNERVAKAKLGPGPEQAGFDCGIGSITWDAEPISSSPNQWGVAGLRRGNEQEPLCVRW